MPQSRVSVLILWLYLLKGLIWCISTSIIEPQREQVFSGVHFFRVIAPIIGKVPKESFFFPVMNFHGCLGKELKYFMISVWEDRLRFRPTENFFVTLPILESLYFRFMRRASEVHSIDLTIHIKVDRLFTKL